MVAKMVNVSSRRFTYGFSGAEYPDLSSAKWMAKSEYESLKKKYGDDLVETFDQALVMGLTSVYLKLTRVVK